MTKGKMLTFAGVLALGAAVLGATHWHTSQAQATIQPLKIASITAVSSSNPRGNYLHYDAATQVTNFYCDSAKICNENNGISLFTGNFPTPYTECGHLGLAANVPNTTDVALANVWENRNTCRGNVAVGIADDVQEQVLSLTGLTQEGKSFSLDVYVPNMYGAHFGNWRLYIDDAGATYHCRADHNYSVLRYPNDCDLTLDQALRPEHLARAGNGPVAGNGLCQAGESPYTAPQDCGNPKTFAGQATFQYGDAGGSAETNAIIKQKVINLRNTGSHPDIFRTTLPVNPETRCGLRGPNISPPANILPNTLPITLDVPLGVNEGTYISVACVTQGLPTVPFTWSYKTVSVGALDVNRTDVNPLLAEVQDMVQITEPIPCSDSDAGANAAVKGIATGTYNGARPGYVAIYGQEPSPTTPKTTTEKFSTYIDHCATSTQLNEGFCNTDGRLHAIGISCANGCKDGVCVVPPASSSSSSSTSVAAARCTDSDNGQAFEIPGTVRDTSRVYSDECIVYVSANGFQTRTSCTTQEDRCSVREGFCVPSGSYYTIEAHLCPYGCRDGACLSLTTSSLSTSSSSPIVATGSTLGNQATSRAWASSAAIPSVAAPSVPSITPSFPTALPARSGATLPQKVPIPTIHPAPSPALPKVQTGSTTVSKKASKARVQALKKQQQALRKELRTLERSLLRKKNVAALSQIADLRDELADLDLRDPSAAENLRSIQEEIADLRQVVSKKTKRGK